MMSVNQIRRFGLAGRTSFTLIELLVAIGIIAVLSAITAMSYRGIAKDAKLASAKNTVMAMLDNARGLAMKNNQIVCVVFRARLDGNKQYIEAVTAKWSGQSARITVGLSQNAVIDRFVPLPGVPTKRLPVGIKIAGPAFIFDTGGTQMLTDLRAAGANISTLDEAWVTSTHLPAIVQAGQSGSSGPGDGEAPGDMIGVMYAADGTTISRNSHTDSNRSWVDFDNDGVQDWGGQVTDYFGAPLNLQSNCTSCPVNLSSPYCYDWRWSQRFENDESWIDFVSYIAVFDDDRARELNDVTKWNPATGGNTACTKRMADYTTYIINNADRIHFNRYTGVALK